MNNQWQKCKHNRDESANGEHFYMSGTNPHYPVQTGKSRKWREGIWCIKFWKERLVHTLEVKSVERSVDGEGTDRGRSVCLHSGVMATFVEKVSGKALSHVCLNHPCPLADSGEPIPLLFNLWLTKSNQGSESENLRGSQCWKQSLSYLPDPIKTRTRQPQCSCI